MPAASQARQTEKGNTTGHAFLPISEQVHAKDSETQRHRNRFVGSLSAAGQPTGRVRRERKNTSSFATFRRVKVEWLPECHVCVTGSSRLAGERGTGCLVDHSGLTTAEVSPLAVT